MSKIALKLVEEMHLSWDYGQVLHTDSTRKKCEMFYIQKSWQFSKSKTIWVTFLYTKIQTLYVTRSFMKFLKLAFIYKKHDTLCYVKFSYTKRQTIIKNQDNMRYVFIYTNPDTLRYAIFMEFLKLAEGGRTLICK